VSVLPLSILLIDEDAPTRNYFGALLSKRNYLVQAVSSGREGFIAALRDRPDVIILDAGLSDMPAAELVKKLRSDKRSATTLCIALAAPSSSAKITELLSAGCNEFFLKTPDAVEKLLNMLSNPSPEDKPKMAVVGQKKMRSGGFLGVFLSAKGGVGTTSLCANIAQNIAKNTPELDVAVMDLVFPIGSIASIVGYEGDFNIQTASRSIADLSKDSLYRKLPLLENWRFRLLAGSPDPETANSLDIFQFPEISESVRKAFDLTLIDLGRSLSATNLSIIQQADVVVVITGADLSTLKLTQAVWQFLKQKGIEQQRVYMLLNRSMGLEGLSKSDAERILGMDIRAATPYFGGSFALANNQHLPIMMKLPNDTAAMMIDQISREIMETARHARV
jgi:Flp pilus assembly CpaE family ATPase